MNDNWGQAVFSPQSIALVGATAKPGKLGYVLLRNLLHDFSGAVYPIHPSERRLLGHLAYPHVQDVPDRVDLVVIATPASTTLTIMNDCARASVRAVILMSAGFAEIGDEGRALQEQIVATARENAIRLIGPNCFGVINVHAGLNASLGMGLPKRGGVSLFTQSGAYGMAAFSRSTEEGIGFAKVIAPGNMADLDEIDVLQYFASDPETRVIALVLESIRDGVALIEAMRTVTPCKPIIVLKTGRGSAAKRAVASHTAALAGDYAVAANALRQAGVRLVDDGLTLLDVAAALDRQPPLERGRVGIITNSGGTGVELADLIEAEGLLVPRLSEALQRKIKQHLPEYGSAQNPIDITPDWSRFAEMYGETVKILLASDEVDAVMPVLLQRAALMPEVSKQIIAEVRAARQAGCTKPVHVCWVAPAEADTNRQRLVDAGIPCHPWAARAARVLGLCRSIQMHIPPPIAESLPAPEGADAQGWLSPDIVFNQLQATGMPVAPWCVAQTPSEATKAAKSLGFPICLKAVRPGLVHKAQAGGVQLGLTDPRAVSETAQTFIERFGSGPVVIQRQVQPGLEFMLGAMRDPQFGPVVLFGLGGIWVEVLNDVAIRLAPFDETEAASMLHELRGARPLFESDWSQRVVDSEALIRLIATVSVWVARAPWLAELDINPIIANDGGFVVVDARLRVMANMNHKANVNESRELSKHSTRTAEQRAGSMS